MSQAELSLSVPPFDPAIHLVNPTEEITSKWNEVTLVNVPGHGAVLSSIEYDNFKQLFRDAEEALKGALAADPPEKLSHLVPRLAADALIEARNEEQADLAGGGGNADDENRGMDRDKLAQLLASMAVDGVDLNKVRFQLMEMGEYVLADKVGATIRERENAGQDLAQAQPPPEAAPPAHRVAVEEEKTNAQKLSEKWEEWVQEGLKLGLPIASAVKGANALLAAHRFAYDVNPEGRILSTPHDMVGTQLQQHGENHMIAAVEEAKEANKRNANPAFAALVDYKGFPNLACTDCGAGFAQLGNMVAAPTEAVGKAQSQEATV